MGGMITSDADLTRQLNWADDGWAVRDEPIFQVVQRLRPVAPIQKSEPGFDRARRRARIALRGPALDGQQVERYDGAHHRRSGVPWTGDRTRRRTS